jgi:hypothetical protein
MSGNIILRTDAGEIIGRFRTAHLARAHAETLGAECLSKVLVIQTCDGIVMSRRYPSEG